MAAGRRRREVPDGRVGPLGPRGRRRGQVPVLGHQEWLDRKLPLAGGGGPWGRRVRPVQLERAAGVRFGGRRGALGGRRPPPVEDSVVCLHNVRLHAQAEHLVRKVLRDVHAVTDIGHDLVIKIDVKLLLFRGQSQVWREVDLEPLVLPNLCDGHPLHGVHHEDALNEADGPLREGAGDDVPPLLDLLEQHRQVLVIEGQPPT
mmetsp:Transcript_108426/g.187305  ORF Transcript_108426/g.187305 Transcript_108426/m.187305 type:complete len:203 (-) Transcript_108426:792-1400(-)